MTSEPFLLFLLVLEKNQLVQLFPDPFTCETLGVLFAKMVQSDLAVAFCGGLNQPKMWFSFTAVSTIWSSSS